MKVPEPKIVKKAKFLGGEKSRKKKPKMMLRIPKKKKQYENFIKVWCFEEVVNFSRA